MRHHYETTTVVSGDLIVLYLELAGLHNYKTTTAVSDDLIVLYLQLAGLHLQLAGLHCVSRHWPSRQLFDSRGHFHLQLSENFVP